MAFATVHLMERLSAERAVFVLREAFELPYDQIAEILGSSAAACRQTFRRAAGTWRMVGPVHASHRSSSGCSRLPSGRAGRRPDGLVKLLATTSSAGRTGAGWAQACVHRGPAKGFSFWAGLFRRYTFSDPDVVEINGQVGLRMALGRQIQVLTWTSGTGRSSDLLVGQPHKLSRFS